MKKKTLAVLLSAAMLVTGILSGCGGGGSTSSAASSGSTDSTSSTAGESSASESTDRHSGPVQQLHVRYEHELRYSSADERTPLGNGHRFR